MPTYQENHSFQLLIDGVDYISYALRGSLSIVQAENDEIGSLTVRLENWDNTLDFTNELWAEVYLKTLTGIYVFGGYLISAIPEHSKAEDRAIWTLKCESWATLFKRVPSVKATYVGYTAKAIVQALFTAAGLTAFDTSTYVSTGDVIASFVTADESLPDLLNRLSGIANLSAGTTYVWWITPDKKVRFGPATAFAAPFGIAPIASANWTTTFPVLRSLSKNYEYPSVSSSTDTNSNSGSNNNTGSGSTPPRRY